MMIHVSITIMTKTLTPSFCLFSSSKPANEAFIALQAAESGLGNAQAYRDWAKSQVRRKRSPITRIEPNERETQKTSN